ASGGRAQGRTVARRRAADQVAPDVEGGVGHRRRTGRLERAQPRSHRERPVTPADGADERLGEDVAVRAETRRIDRQYHAEPSSPGPDPPDPARHPLSPTLAAWATGGSRGRPRASGLGGAPYNQESYRSGSPR